MPSIEQCRQSLRNWILKIFTDKEVLISNFNGAQPSESYFTIKIIRGKWYPHPVSNIISDTEEIVNGYVTLYFSIQCIGGDDPRGNLQQLVNSFETTSAEIYFYQNEMGVCGISGEITDMPEVIGQEWEERASMTAMFDAVIPHTFDPEFATSAEITINGDDTITISGD